MRSRRLGLLRILRRLVTGRPMNDGLATERDACGVGFVADARGRRSYTILQHALTAVANLSHRGAVAADGKTGDGAGVMTQLPYAVLRRDLDIRAPDDHLAVGMCFLPAALRDRERAMALVQEVIAQTGLRLVGWRDVPTDLDALGDHARATQPHIAQVVVAQPGTMAGDAFDRALYLCRRWSERRAGEAGLALYVPSCSRRTVVYKALLTSPWLSRFYRDLTDPIYETALAVFHQRYSTNTFPSWSLAQPTRQLAHNGEINTIRGNLHWMKAREGTFFSPFWGSRMKDLLPVIQPGGSDSAQLDDALELLTHSGRDLLQSVQMLIPPAWEQDAELTSEQRAWCEFHAGITEPWDGPAALVFSDGHYVGAALDRNGLRPARYTLTSNGLLILDSEAGVVPLEAHDVVEKGRLGPGEMIGVDLQHGVLMRNRGIKTVLAQRQAYQRWLERYLVR